MTEKPSVNTRRERIVRFTINGLLIFIFISILFAGWDKSRSWNTAPQQAGVENQDPTDTTANEEPTDTITAESRQESVKVDLAPLDFSAKTDMIQISRKPELETIFPSRPRVDVITYTVETGDSLFSIADNFGVKPETILWGNYETLEDNPHLLSKGQVLNILPTNGTYYEWQEGDNLSQVANFFGVEAEDVLSYMGNPIDLTATPDDPGIEPGTWLIVPGGKRELKDWGPPAITRNNPASASYYGPGYCGAIYSGAVGTGTFVWPTPARFLSGYGYSSIHPAVDIAGAEGNAIFATDNGVVVYAGWSNYGYGYLIVVDHGNGWQSAYAHLSAVAVTCGQSVFQGSYIGALGNTGNSTGPHLHFELVYNGAKPNPLDYIQ